MERWRPYTKPSVADRLEISLLQKITQDFNLKYARIFEASGDGISLVTTNQVMEINGVETRSRICNVGDIEFVSRADNPEFGFYQFPLVDPQTLEQLFSLIAHCNDKTVTYRLYVNGHQYSDHN
ncbi:MAG: hypothetical protein NTW79_00325 [Candidatus Berkelbacteria bacterium]|nr:hypothetical protein [Candidatus Berkelbacteria bacterium]